MTDQHHFRCLGCMGHPDLKTPHIDRLARDGVLFENAHCQSPVCQPSRVSMLTARYVHTTRQFGFEGMLDPDIPLMPRFFNDAGYRTAMAGKLHIGTLPKECGAEFVSSTICEDSWRVLGGGTAYEDYVKGKGYAYPTDQTHGGYPNEVAPQSARPDEPRNVQMTGKSDIPLADSLERWTANEALRYLSETDADERPFWMWLTFDRPHHPWAASAPYDTLYSPQELTLSPHETADQIMKKPISHFRDLTGECATDESYFRRILASYYGLISHIDAEIGRVLHYLDEKGLYDSTTIVFTADHGDGGGVARLLEKTRGVGAGAVTRVPLIIKPAHSVLKDYHVKEEVELIDLWPTLAAYHGISLPVRHSVEGKDLSGVLTGGKASSGVPALCEHYTERSIARNGYRLVYYLQHSELGELYDTGNDPEERRNLYSLPACREKRIELKMEMIKKLSPPFDQRDVETIEKQVMSHPIRHRKWQPRQKTEKSSPISVTEGRGLWLVNSELYQLFLRLDGARHTVYRVADYSEGLSDDRVDIFGTNEFGLAELETHLDLLLDWLFLRIRPMDVVGASLMGQDLEYFPERGEVEAFLRTMEKKEKWPWKHGYCDSEIKR